METGGLGVGLGVTMKAKEVDSITIGTSQNIPVNPAKHSHMIVSFPRSKHSPLVQLTKSHNEMGGDGVGEIDTELIGMVDVVNVEKGRSKLSELETKKKMDEVVMTPRSEVVAGVGVMKSEVDGSKMSQNSPVNPAKH